MLHCNCQPRAQIVQRSKDGPRRGGFPTALSKRSLRAASNHAAAGGSHKGRRPRWHPLRLLHIQPRRANLVPEGGIKPPLLGPSFDHHATRGHAMEGTRSATPLWRASSGANIPRQRRPFIDESRVNVQHERRARIEFFQGRIHAHDPPGRDHGQRSPLGNELHDLRGALAQRTAAQATVLPAVAGQALSGRWSYS